MSVRLVSLTVVSIIVCLIVLQAPFAPPQVHVNVATHGDLLASQGAFSSSSGQSSASNGAVQSAAVTTASPSQNDEDRSGQQQQRQQQLLLEEHQKQQKPPQQSGLLLGTGPTNVIPGMAAIKDTIKPMSQIDLFVRRQTYGPMIDPHPRGPAVNGITPPHKGPPRGSHQLPICQFNATDAAIAMAEDPHYVLPVPKLGTRYDLPGIVACEGFTRGAELGVQNGYFAKHMMQSWKGLEKYVLVDLWQTQANYEDQANVPQHIQDKIMRDALKRLKKARDRIILCRNYTTECAKRFPHGWFDFVYVDARHDRLGVLADLEAWWPLLRRGGLMCGHDYVTQSDLDLLAAPRDKPQQWFINFDGTVDSTGLTVRGAVDDYFMSWQSRVTDHHRQITVSREKHWNTWCARK